MKELYSENYVTVMTETKDNANKWNMHLCLQTGKINIVKLSMLPKANYRFKAIPIKIQTQLLTELEQIILKHIWNLKRFQIAPAFLRKEEQS